MRGLVDDIRCIVKLYTPRLMGTTLYNERKDVNTEEIDDRERILFNVKNMYQINDL